jgi:hypothetical protein
VVEASVLTMIADLGTILEENADTALVDAAARSLMEAGSIGRERLPNAGTAARRALASGLGVRLRGIEQVRSIDVENLRPILRGARDLRDWLVRHASEDADVARAAGGLAGDMVTFLDARVRAGAAVMRDESAFDAQFAAIAETLLEYADQRLATATGGKRAFTGPVALQEKLIAGDIRAFTTEALAAEQRLSSPSGPFKFKPERFVRP